MNTGRTAGAEISAIICTRNRSADLARCLRALAGQTLPSSLYEVIVVDNGSSDDTRSVAASFCDQRVNFRYVHEEKAGLAIARNTGISISSGAIVAFTDDDAEPEVSWLQRILARFREHPRDVGIVGGDVIPVWETQRPVWLTDDLLRPLSAGLKWSTEPRFLRGGEWLVEVNAAYRKRVLAQIGGFPEHLGRVGEILLSGEGGVDRLIRRAGFKLYYDPAILVRHHIPASRLTRTWFRRRSFWQGVSLNLLHRYVEETARKLGLPEPARRARILEDLVVPVSAGAWGDLFDDRSSIMDFHKQLNCLEQLGYLLESQSVIIGR
jgi:glycosyltransferase involved in cell wall biosynthesis